MSDENYIPSRLNDEPTQYRDLDYNLRPTDPGIERMLEDFEKSEIEEWKFNMAQFYNVCESQWRDPHYEVDIHEVGFSKATMMPFTIEEFQKRLSDEALLDELRLDEALLDDLERYEEEEKKFWMMRGVAQMYGMWDEEYWQTWWPGPWLESTCRLGHEEIEVNSPLQAERWWEQLRKRDEHGTPSVTFWRGLPGRPNRCTESWKHIHEVPSIFKATECPGPEDDGLASLGSECGQNSVYHELPEEDLDWVKLDKEHIALPLPPSPIVETYYLEIPKIPEPESEQDEAWTLIVSSERERPYSRRIVA
ncbi:hypothetical protein B9Z19DRAFT_1066441 [Tuber borchii]|uniref:Uncharacterized protein n=1 Tax=Tuber borchii TaxID=42251 RepID=A0A2T6ZMI4_TUBBO|nr:hypothetical protein B9Z19DRAFT_1066441 [Tuber borchii]